MNRQNGKHDAPERVTIQEAARRLNKSDKTVRRLVHRGRLHPVTVEGKFLFDVSELDAMIEAEQPGPTLESEVAALRNEVKELRQAVSELETKMKDFSMPRTPAAPRKQPVVPQKQKREPIKTEGEVPGFVKAMDFAEQHHVKPETARKQFQRQTIETTKPEGTQQSHYLTAEQQRKAIDYWEAHKTPNFIRCAECPHG